MGVRNKAKKLNSEQLWDYSLRALGQRAHSVHELRQKLLRRAEAAADVAATLVKLQEYGLTDDRKFSDAVASARLENQGFGRMRVLRELRSKRVADSVATEAVARTYANSAEPDLIAAFLERKYRNRDLHEFLQDQKNVASAFRRLRTAGFSSGGSLAALKRYAGRIEDWAEPIEEEEE